MDPHILVVANLLKVDGVYKAGGAQAIGAFAFGLGSGLAPEAAARLAVACASESVRGHGTQTSFLGRDAARALAAPYLGGS